MKAILTALLLTALVGCGGGGESTPHDAETPPTEGAPTTDEVTPATRGTLDWDSKAWGTNWQ